MMTRVDNKTRRIENLDRISELTEPIILDIMSRLPLADAARASVLSKTWKSFCGLYPILCFDHNTFALQPVVLATEGGREPDIDQIRAMFMDYVDYHLSTAHQLTSPIRRLALIVSVNDSIHFPRVDAWLESVRQLNIEDLSLFVQTVASLWESPLCQQSEVYELPVSVLGSKGLRSVCIRGCKLVCKTFVGDLVDRMGVSFSSLKKLCLQNVYMNGDALENLVWFCQEIETLVLKDCDIVAESLKISKFPKLKKAIIEDCDWELDSVDIVDTNLEYLTMRASNEEVEFNMSPKACAGIKELTLMSFTLNQPSLFKDLTATFPIIEGVDLRTHEIDTLKATSNVLKKLHFFTDERMLVKEVHLDCPNLTSLRFTAPHLTDLYVDCPKLREFYYSADIIPEQLFFKATDLQKSTCNITLLDTADALLWFINLREFLVNVMGNTTLVVLTFCSPLTTFKAEGVEDIQASPLHNVHLRVRFDLNMEDVAATIVDAMLWIIRPTTLEVSAIHYCVIKHLCKNLLKISQDNICEEQACWTRLLKDFQIESPRNMPIIKEDLAILPERSRTKKQLCLFKFQWS